MISRWSFLVYLTLGLAKAPSLTGEVLDSNEKQPIVLRFPTAGDCVFLRRVILQSRSDGEARLLQSKALELEQLLQTMPVAGELPIEEQCPACGSEIPFRDIRTAACENGHPWSEFLEANSQNGFIDRLSDGPQSSPMLDNYVRTFDFSGADVSRMYTQDVFSCSVGFRGPSVYDRGEPVDSWGSTSRDPMLVLWKPFRILAVAFFILFHGFWRSFAQMSLGGFRSVRCRELPKRQGGGSIRSPSHAHVVSRPRFSDKTPRL